MNQEDFRSKTQTLPSEQLRQETSLLDVLIVLARRKRFILLFTFCVAIVTVVVSLVLPVRYTATTVLLPPSQSTSASSMLLSQMSGGLGSLASMAGAGLGIKDPNDMYAALFHTRTVETAMIRRFSLMQEYHVKRESDARKKFEDRSTVIVGVKDGLLRISVEDHNAQRAADLANGYVEEFRNISAHLAITEAARRRLFFEQQLNEAKNNLADAEIALEKTEQTTGIVQPTGQAVALIQSAVAIRAQITAKEVEIQGLRSYATENNPNLMIAEQELAALRSQLAKLNGGGQDQGSDSDLIPPRMKMSEAGMEYIRKYRDVRYYETVFDLLAKQYEMAKLDEAREGPIVQVVDPAVPPDKKSFPKRSMIVLLAAFAAFVIAVLWALIADRWNRLISGPESDERVKTLLALLPSKARHLH